VLFGKAAQCAPGLAVQNAAPGNDERAFGAAQQGGGSGQLGEAGFDPVYGARPLKRAIQQQVENPLAERILRGEFLPGDSITIDAAEGALQFGKSVR